MFNTAFELSLRIILLLHAAKRKALSIDHIAAFDFITVYGKAFGVSSYSLNGENEFGFAGFAARRGRMQDAIKLLVLDGLVEVHRSSEGFLYTVSQRGEKYVSSLKTDYASLYLDIAAITLERYGECSGPGLVKEIGNISTGSLRR